MYIQNRHMECGESHICHDLVSDQSINDNACSTPLLHEALDVDHKMVILGIGLYYNKFSHLCLQHQYYPEHDILCLSILFSWIFFYIYLINGSMSPMIFRHIFLELFIQTDIIFLCAIMH